MGAVPLTEGDSVIVVVVMVGFVSPASVNESVAIRAQLMLLIKLMQIISVVSLSIFIFIKTSLENAAQIAILED